MRKQYAGINVFKLRIFLEKLYPDFFLVQEGQTQLDEEYVDCLIISRRDGDNEKFENIELFVDPESNHLEWYSCGVGDSMGVGLIGLDGFEITESQFGDLFDGLLTSSEDRYPGINNPNLS